MSYQLTHHHLLRLCQVNAFPIPSDGTVVFFGLRGCLPADPFDHSPAPGKTLLDYTAPNYSSPHCALGQWNPANGTLSVFPGSTVPTRKYVAKFRPNGGVGVNEMMTGYYGDYRKGMHKANSGSGHPAFRQNADRPYRRTADDLDYDADDRVELDNPSDNLHAAYCSTVSGEYSSAGCQVVVGQPTRNDGKCQESGPWKVFRTRAYALTQQAFPYILLDGWEAQRMSNLGGDPIPALLRFGSTGLLVSTAQAALKGRGYYEGNIDTSFGPRMAKAVLRFQEAAFGSGGDDGIVGPATAEVLGIHDWPAL